MAIAREGRRGWGGITGINQYGKPAIGVVIADNASLGGCCYNGDGNDEQQWELLSKITRVTL